MTEMIELTILEQLHKELDGQCQKCSQRCDRSVVRVVDKLMLCPDCAGGKDRPVFTVKSHVIKRCFELTGWEKDRTEEYLQHIPLEWVLVEHSDRKRTYWNFDKKSPIFRIYSDHAGLINRIQFRQQIVGKRRKSILVKGQRRLVSQKMELTLKKIHIPEELQQSSPMEFKLAMNFDTYEKNGHFHSDIIILHENHSQEQPFTLLDGYSAYIVAKELGLKTVDVIKVGIPAGGDGQQSIYRPTKDTQGIISI